MVHFKDKVVRNISVFFVLLLSTCYVFAQGDTTSTYYFAHSLINHQKLTDNQANIPYWLAEMETAAGDVCLTSGQYAAGQFGANAIPPEQTWSFYYRNQNHESAMYPGDTYPANAHDNVILTHMNWEIIYDWGPQIGERQEDEVDQATESIGIIFDWMDTNDPEANLYLYECWPKIETDVILDGIGWTSSSGNPPNANQWTAYLTYALGHSNNFWVELQDNLISTGGFSELKSIPSSMICAKLWQPGGLLDDFAVTDIFEDDGPHGLASSYFLAAMIVYAAEHQEAPTRPFTSHEQIDQRLLDRFDQIAAFIMTELAGWNFPNGSSRVWFADSDSENPLFAGNLTTNTITYNSANLTWDNATDNVGATAYEIYIDGALEGISFTNAYTLTELDCDTDYSNVQVRALDAAGNTSSFITTSLTTAACPTDTEPPTVPTGLSSARIDNSSAYITWDASTDNYGIESYTISINGIAVSTQAGTAYTVTDLNCDQTYAISVFATDISGNESNSSGTNETNSCVPVFTLTLTYDNNMGDIQVAPTPEATYQNGELIASYEEGTNITFYRYPASGYQFEGYTNDLVSSEDPASFTMNGNMNITANFSEVAIPDGTLLTWDFPDNSTTANADIVSPGLNTSVVDINSHLGAGSYGDGLEVLNFTSTTLEEAISNGDYIHFNVSPQVDKVVNISAINIRPMSQNRDRYFALFSSQTGFSSADMIESVTYMGISSPMVEIAVADHLDIETEIEFRIYIYGDNPNQYESAGLTGAGNDLEVIGSVEDNLITAFSQDQDQSNRLTIYPNPVQNYINVSTSEQNFEIDIINTFGQVVIQESNNKKIDISTLSKGTYIVSVKGNTMNEQQLIVIE